jgi:hypothetical protein
MANPDPFRCKALNQNTFQLRRATLRRWFPGHPLKKPRRRGRWRDWSLKLLQNGEVSDPNRRQVLIAGLQSESGHLDLARTGHLN